MGWKVIIKKIKRCIVRPDNCIKRVTEITFELANDYIRNVDKFFKIVIKIFIGVWKIIERRVEKYINRPFLRRIVEKRMTPFVSFLISIVLVVILAIFLCIEQYSLAIAFIFGITTLLAWILSIFIYQEVRTHIGSLHDLLEKTSKHIEEANSKITIVCLAPNIGQAVCKSAFNQYYKKKLEQQFYTKKAEIEMIAPNKFKIMCFLEKTLKEQKFSDRRKIEYKNKASDFFQKVMDNTKGLILSKPLPFTIIYIDDRVTTIINNDTCEGFLSVKPYEVKIIKKLIDFMKVEFKDYRPFVLPKTNGSGRWIDS